MNDILEFQGENRWLSNFWPVSIKFEDAIYPSVEHAYVASKTLNKILREEIRLASTPGKARRLGRIMGLRSDWLSIRVGLMQGFIGLKFQPDNQLGAKLVATGDCEIIEGNSWGDTFWGVCEGKGANALGKIIMVRRGYLKRFLK